MNLRAAIAIIAISLLAPFLVRTDPSAETRPRNFVSRQTGSAAAKPATPVLVELFTSEGCSSCPPADKLLAQINARQPVKGAEAIILEEHVDYWDDLGWHDPFASAAVTQRQKDYAKTIRAEVYTPQMIVDGRTDVLGSDQRAAERAIEKTSGTPKTGLELSWVGATATMGGPKLLRVRAGKLSGGESAEVFMAITESHLHSDVKRGENAGRGLEHDGVVRKFTSLGKANSAGEFSFDAQSAVKLSPEWKRREHSRRRFPAGCSLAPNLRRNFNDLLA